MDKNKRLIVFGCGGHSRSILDVALEAFDKDNILIVDEKAEEGEIILECRSYKDYYFNKDDQFIVAIGDNRKRNELYKQILFQYPSCRPVSIISELAFVEKEVQIGAGVFVANLAYIGPQSCIGDNTIINTAAVIEHEVIIGSNVHIAPNVTICGRCKIGDDTFIGAGSTIIDKREICQNVIIGAGSVVVSNIKKSGTYVGIPAKEIR